MRKILIVAVALLVLASAGQVSAALFSDGFESHNIGALDKNLSGGPNAAPNGSGNPWFGPAPPNAQVVGVDSGVSPHSGSHMIRGAFVAGADIDQNWYNMAYRLNGGLPFKGNLEFDWWFYDPLGAVGASGLNFRDYAAIGYYNTAPGGTDYPGAGSLNSGATQIQRLSLGANNTSGVDPNFYQVRVVGATDGLGTTGWFNTSVGRSVGWHHGKIVIGSPLVNNTNNVDFYIDNMLSPIFSHNSMTTWGYNVIEVNTKFGSATGYFDDFNLVPEPGSLVALGAGLLSLIGLKRTRRS